MSKPSTTTSKEHYSDPSKKWLNPGPYPYKKIRLPHELKNELIYPPDDDDKETLNRVLGSIMGLAMGDAVGAHVEFRPQQFLAKNPVKDLRGGGTWGLNEGEFTDDTSMALCLANSLVVRRDFILYDQLVRYKWWFRNGYMSSTGKCFDIGAATKRSLIEFEHRQQVFMERHKISPEKLDSLSDRKLLSQFPVDCSEIDAAGNGALMRLAPVPLFFREHPRHAVEFSGASGRITHGNPIAYDACRYYGALIVAALQGMDKTDLLDANFYSKHQNWFDYKPLHEHVMTVVNGSYKKSEGHKEGIRGKGYIIQALEAALWAFWSDKNSFETGVLAAVNLGDDTDTTAAIYGQLAGAYYGYDRLPKIWLKSMYAKDFILCLSKWIVYEGQRWDPEKSQASIMSVSTSFSKSNTTPITASAAQRQTPNTKAPSIAQNRASNTNASNSQTKQQPHAQKTPKKSSEPEPEKNSQQKSSWETSPVDEKTTTAKIRQTSDNNEGANQNDSSNGFNDSTVPKTTQIQDEAHSSQPGYAVERLRTCEGVGDWLQEFGKDYHPYVVSFKEHMVDGFWLLNYVNEESLIKYDVSNENHRHTILAGIQKLKG